jgi:hypothetical protein
MEHSNKQSLERLEETARAINKAFTLCATDRSGTVNESKRAAVLPIAAILFKIYFKVTYHRHLLLSLATDRPSN